MSDTTITIEDIQKLAADLKIHEKDNPLFWNPLAFNGMPVYEVKPRMIPIIQISEDFKWLTDEARARLNAQLIELVGCREVCPLPKDSIYMYGNNIIARPETISILNTMA